MFGILVAVNPAEHSIVACLWAFRRLFRGGKCKIYILLVTGYTSEKYFVPLASCISSKVGQNRPGPALAEFLLQQIQQEFPQCQIGVDFEMSTETGCPVEKIRTFVLDREIRVLVMGEKHPLSKNQTKWSNTVFSCLRECPCMSLVVRPTCFDIVQTEPLIEIFRHPQLEFDDFGWWSHFLGESASVQTKKEELPKAAPVQEAIVPFVNPPEAAPKTKKQFFGNLLKNANKTKEEEPKEQIQPKEQASIQAREKAHFAGPVRRAPIFDDSNVELAQKVQQATENRLEIELNKEFENQREIISERPSEIAPQSEQKIDFEKKIESESDKRIEREQETKAERELERKNTPQPEKITQNESERKFEQEYDGNTHSEPKNNPAQPELPAKEFESTIDNAQKSEEQTPRSKWRSMHLDELNDKWMKSKEAKKLQPEENKEVLEKFNSDKATKEYSHQNDDSIEKEYFNENQEIVDESRPSSLNAPNEVTEVGKKQKKSFFQKLLTKERSENPTSEKATSKNTESIREMEKQQFAGPSRQK